MTQGRFRLRPGIDPLAARELGGALGVSAAIGQVLLHRGITTEAEGREFLHPKLSGLTPPEAMADREVAAERIARAVRAHERVAIFGDYDVDGTTSAAILGSILRAFGGDVRILVANRFSGGYGFSRPALERVKATGASLLITCDCGSSDHERVALANEAGIDVIVVDHHLVPKDPLPALAFLNPHRPACGFPYKGLASAGLALSVGAAVRAALGSKVDLRAWLDLVALGTIADVAPLDGDNRRLVRAGLMRLASPSARAGVQALREAARIRPGACVGGVDVAFRMAPRLNAAGRLGDPEVTLRLLLEEDLLRARAIAARIERINQERREIQEQNTEEAIAQAKELYGDRPTGGVVVASSSWHRGVVGIVAARLTERFGVPAIVIAIEGEHGHGSGRSVEGFPLYTAIGESRSELLKFGGHEAAAGLTLLAGRVEAFRADFDRSSRPHLAALPEGERAPWVDAVLGPAGMPLPSAKELALLEPIGEGNEEPLFLLRGAAIEDRRIVGEGHLRLGLRVGNRSISAFGWEMGALVDRATEADGVLGALRPDSYRGGDAVELRVSALLSGDEAISESE